MINPVSAIAGGVVGYLLGRSGKLEARTLDQVLKELQANKPANIWVQTFSASEARTGAELVVAGDYLYAALDISATPFTIQLNEKDTPFIDLARVKAVRAPYYRIFITNQAGNGSITFIGGKGLELVPRLPGIEELAARLGSPSTFDKRGEILYYDDFESTLLKWGTQATGTGASVARDTTRANRGNASVKVVSGNVSGNTSSLFKRFPMPVKSKIGVEWSFNLNEATTGSLIIDIRFHTGTAYIEGEVDLVLNDGSIKYRGSDGDLHDLATKVLGVDNNYVFFHKAKLVVDWQASKYVRLILDETEYELPNLALLNVASPEISCMETSIYLTIAEAANRAIYADDFILTQNEP